MSALFACALLAAILSSVPLAAPADSLAALVPAEVDGWKGDGMDGTYDADSLYRNSPAGAEVYVALNVRTIFARRFEKKGAPEIIVDLFDMGSAADAYGAYHHDMREGKSAGIGRESELSSTSLAFWKGRYFLSIVAFDDQPEARAALLSLGKAIAAAIPDAGGPPSLVSLLPPKGLQASRLHYFHDHLTLHSHYLLARDNVLSLDKGTECALARYAYAGSGDGGQEQWALLLVRYPDEARAEKAVAAFRKVVLRSADGDGAGTLEDGTWAAARTVGAHAVIALDAPTRQRALTAVAQAALQVAGMKPNPGEKP